MADEFLIPLATFGFTVLGTAMATTWAMGKMLAKRDASLIAMMSAHELADSERFAAVHAKISDLGESVRHEFGETGAALRQKMHDMEMWGRDNNLNKKSFERVMDGITQSINTVAGKVDSVISRNGRIDKGRHES